MRPFQEKHMKNETDTSPKDAGNHVFYCFVSPRTAGSDGPRIFRLQSSRDTFAYFSVMERALESYSARLEWKASAIALGAKQPRTGHGNVHCMQHKRIPVQWIVWFRRQQQPKHARQHRGYRGICRVVSPEHTVAHFARAIDVTVIDLTTHLQSN
jgi:hypothetical protein